MEPRIPTQAQEALQTLQCAGFEAYLVGGCVRDSLLGLIPHDWDITTSALPEETARLFGCFGRHVTSYLRSPFDEVNVECGRSEVGIIFLQYIAFHFG